MRVKVEPPATAPLETAITVNLNLLFVALAFDRRPPLRERGETRGPEQPAGQNRLLRELPGFLREDRKYRLRDFFGEMRIAHLAHRSRIHEADAPRNQRLEGCFGIVRGILAQQGHVVH
jgi:hypothetical protein